MNPAIRSRQTLLVALMVALLMAAAVLSAVPARAGSRALDAEILGIEPVVLVEGSDLSVQVRVTNRGETALTGATVKLLAQEWTPNTRSSLASWLDEDRYDATLLLNTSELPTLAPDAGHTLTITVPAAAFGFNAWGPRGIEVFASAPAGEGGEGPEPDRERAWVLWWDEPAVSPVGIGFLSPVTPTVDEMAEPTAERLRALLDQGAIDGVTPIVDPAVLEVSAPDSTTIAGIAGKAWTLPWGNADSAAVLAAGHPEVLADLRSRGAAALAAAGLRPAGSVDWFASPDLATLAGTAGDVVVVGADSVPPVAERAWTPHAVGELAGRTAVVVDSALGEALLGTARVGGGTLQLSPVQQRQYVAATTAVLVRERPRESRAVFAALPLDDDAAHARLLAAVAALPWVTPTTLSDALADDAVTALDDSGLAPEPDLPAAAVTGAEIREAAAAAASLHLMEQVLEDPQELLSPLLTDLSLVPSATWREAPRARALLLSGASEVAAQLTSGLTIRGASGINMVSESANFPVTVMSTLPAAATVQVVLAPSERGLEQAEPVTLTVAAGGEATAQVPVSGVGSGDITVAIHLGTVAGEQIGQAVDVPVRVRADWENLAMLALVVGGALAFVVGVVRTVVRNRRTGRAARVEADTRDLAALDRAGSGRGAGA